MTVNLRPCAAAATAALAILFGAEPASADAATVLRPSTRPAWYMGGIGPAFAVTGCGRGGCARLRGYGSQFNLHNEMGWHLSGDGTGPGIGGAVDLSFFSGYFRFTPGFRFSWDIPVVEKYAIYVTPSAQAGFSIVDAGPQGFFNTQLSTAGRVVINDRASVFFQPFNMDLNANGNGVFIGWNVLAGGGVTF